MRKNGMTLVEIVVVVMIMGALAAVSVPRLQFQVIYQKQAEASARKLLADLRRTRSLALRDAATNTDGYRLIFGPSEWSHFLRYTIRNEKTSQIVSVTSFDSHVTVTATDEDFEFGPLGNLTKGAEDEIVLSSEGKSYRIRFIEATGAVILTKE